MDIGSVIQNTLTNVNLWAAICSTIGIIALGFILVKVKVFKQEWKGVLNSIVLKVALPALAISGFMSKISIEELSQQGIILGLGFAFYIILSIIAMVWVNYFSKFLPKKIKNKKLQLVSQDGVINNENQQLEIEANTKVQDKRALVMWMMLIFGSTTFFGLPIIQQLYPTNGVIAANLWNVPYRIFLYSFCFMVMAGVKFDKANIKKSC